jgi:hypothetical protein
VPTALNLSDFDALSGGRVGQFDVACPNRLGRSSASLPDGAVLVGSSRQPFLDAHAVDDQVKRPDVQRRKARSDGLFADRRVESRNFAEAVAFAGATVVAP